MLMTRDGHGLVTARRPDAHNQTESVSTKQEDTEHVQEDTLKACQYEATERQVRPSTI